MAERETVFGFEGVDIVSGGFPCQDISSAGKRTGLSGERSGLWREMVCAIRMVRPKYAVVENVAALLYGGMGRVLGDLAESGLCAEWDCLPAAAFGSPHTRDRVIIMASNSMCSGMRPQQERERQEVERVQLPMGNGETWPVARWQNGHWGIRPDIPRASDGVPGRMDRLEHLGNAVIPQIAEWIGRRIIEAEENK